MLGTSAPRAGGAGNRQSAFGKAYQSCLTSPSAALNRMDCGSLARILSSIAMLTMRRHRRRRGRGAGASADGCGGRREPLVGPLAHRGEHGLERTTTRGETVAHAHWWPGVDQSLDDAFGLELAQTLGQHAVADAGYAREQLVEASRCRDERLDHRSRPALAYQLYRALKGRAVVKAPSHHGRDSMRYRESRKGTHPPFPQENSSRHNQGPPSHRGDHTRAWNC